MVAQAVLEGFRYLPKLLSLLVLNTNYSKEIAHSARFSWQLSRQTAKRRHPKDIMAVKVFRKRSHLPVPAARAFRWHESAGALEKLIPPGDPVEVVSRTGGIRNGARVVLRIRIGPFHRLWIAEHQEFQQDRQFQDVQIEGPFAFWRHTHRFEPDGDAACWLEDRVEYQLPFGWLGQAVAGWAVDRKLQQMFAYRHAVTLRSLLED